MHRAIEENIYASADDYYDSASAIYAECSSSSAHLAAIRTRNVKMSSLESSKSSTASKPSSPDSNTTLGSTGSKASCMSPMRQLMAGEHASDDDSGCALHEEYVWVPNGLKPRDVSSISTLLL